LLTGELSNILPNHLAEFQGLPSSDGSEETGQLKKTSENKTINKITLPPCAEQWDSFIVMCNGYLT